MSHEFHHNTITTYILFFDRHIFTTTINSTMNTPLLLTDKQVQDFLINGYIVLQPLSLDRDFHSSIFNQTLSVFNEEGNPGNNVLPRIPQLQYVFDDPVVSGALESLLGANYTMQPHRHPHFSKPGFKEQQWHKDSYFGYQKPLRHHQLRYIMAMYYPQDTTMEMGPTAIKPRTQYSVMGSNAQRRKNQSKNQTTTSDVNDDIRMVCTAGTVVLIHYDIVHKGTANQTKDSPRFMFKFQFNRLEEPTKPTWNHDPTNANYDAVDADLLQPIVKHVWNWMLGDVHHTLESVPIDQNMILEWKEQLHDHDGTIRLYAAYNLALNNQYQILINHLFKIQGLNHFEAVYALTACRYSKEAITELQTILKQQIDHECRAYCIAFIFSEMGSVALEALPLLVHVLQTSNSWLVKQYCCEALGTMQPSNQHDVDIIVRCLTRMLLDRDKQVDSKDASQVRFTAALSLAKIGARAVEAIPALKDALYLDHNRYVNGNALLALQRIGTSEAMKIVFDYLRASRWCAKTTATSQW